MSRHARARWRCAGDENGSLLRAAAPWNAPGAPPASPVRAVSRGATRRGARRSALCLLILALAGGCSSTEELLAGRPQPTQSQSSFTDRFRNLFGGGSESAAPAQSATPGAGQTASSGAAQVRCPPADIRQGASTLQMTAPGSDQALAVRYQATFVRTARQCMVDAGTLSIKIGVQGRLILGPAGAPGETVVPLRYALVEEGIQPKTIWSKLYLVQVSVPADQPNVSFTHVVEDLAVPVPSREELDRYVIYVGFDPQGAAQEKGQKKPQPGQKPKSG